MAAFVIFIDRILFLASNFDNAEPLFALVMAAVFSLHHVEMANQNPASGSL